MSNIDELQLAKELIRFPSITPVDAGVMRFLEKKLKKLGFKIDYFEFIDLKTFSIQTEKRSGIKYAACIAVIISEVRLIDNIIL